MTKTLKNGAKNILGKTGVIIRMEVMFEALPSALITFRYASNLMLTECVKI
jgi:hypothetical protein